MTLVFRALWSAWVGCHNICTLGFRDSDSVDSQVVSRWGSGQQSAILRSLSLHVWWRAVVMGDLSGTLSHLHTTSLELSQSDQWGLGHVQTKTPDFPGLELVC